MPENEQQNGTADSGTVQEPAKRQDCMIFGTVIGTCSSWDQYDTLVFDYSEVEFSEHFAELFGQKQSINVCVDYENGTLQIADDEGHDLYREWKADGPLNFSLSRRSAVSEADKMPSGNEAAQEDLSDQHGEAGETDH